MILIALVGMSVTGHAQPSRGRVIERMPVEKNEPVTVTNIKVNGQSVSFDREFAANDDWMKSLVITVKNKSDKRILYMNVDLFFSEPSSQEPGALFDLLFFGNTALRLRPPTSSEQPIGLAPGESADISVTSKKFIDLTRFLTEIKVSQSVDRVRFKLGRIIFDDDTMWSGEVFRRNPNDPTCWINLNP